MAKSTRQHVFEGIEHRHFELNLRLIRASVEKLLILSQSVFFRTVQRDKAGLSGFPLQGQQKPVELP